MDRQNFVRTLSKQLGGAAREMKVKFHYDARRYFARRAASHTLGREMPFEEGFEIATKLQHKLIDSIMGFKAKIGGKYGVISLDDAQKFTNEFDLCFFPYCKS